MNAICISSSIANFKNKLSMKYAGHPDWGAFHLLTPTIFFGMYHVGDYTKLLAHRGKRLVFWCGSDILNLEKSKKWQKIIASVKAEHVCENDVERLKLESMGIYPRVQPMFFDDITQFEPCFKPSNTPHVFLTAHENSREPYGLNLLEDIARETPDVTYHVYGVKDDSHDNIVYHGRVPTKQFDKEIREYQGALRLNSHDGFAETLAKSILMAQHPISTIQYPYIDYADSIQNVVYLLNHLKDKKEPNLAGATYWKEILQKPL